MLMFLKVELAYIDAKPLCRTLFESKIINISVCLCISNSMLFKITCMTPVCSSYIISSQYSTYKHHPPPLISQNQPDLDAYISKFIGHAWTIYKQGVESYSKWGEIEM